MIFAYPVRYSRRSVYFEQVMDNITPLIDEVLLHITPTAPSCGLYSPRASSPNVFRLRQIWVPRENTMRENSNEYRSTEAAPLSCTGIPRSSPCSRRLAGLMNRCRRWLSALLSIWGVDSYKWSPAGEEASVAFAADRPCGLCAVVVTLSGAHSTGP